MAKFLVLNDYVDSVRHIAAGDIVDDTQQPITELEAAGLAFVAYDPATMDSVIARFRSQRAIGTQPSLTLLALMFAEGLEGVSSVGGTAPIVSSGGPTPVLSITAATTAAQGSVELATVAEALAGTDTTRAVTAAGVAAVVAQPKARAYAGAADTIVAGDIGNVVAYSQAGAVTADLPDLSASLVAGHALLLTLQGVDPLTELTINPGSGVTIDGAGTDFVATPGRTRVALVSFDGLAWFSGAP